MSDRDLAELARKWQEGTLTEEERARFESWYASFDEDTRADFAPDDAMGKRLYRNILRRERILPSSLRLWFPRVAAIFLVATATFLLYRQTPHPAQPQRIHPQPTAKAKAIVPGSEKALLTLADGSTISLDAKADGLLASDHSLSVTKNKGQLNYRASGQMTGEANAYHSIVTPRGGHYQVNLPDGTKAWLNAASSIRFPLSFATAARRVQISGEVYFEVASQKRSGKKIPFIVESPGQQIEVLGTHFNVNAYSNEPATLTTLLEGSVRVVQTGTGQAAMLRPGQQAALGASVTVAEVNTADAVAWQKGYFAFNNEPVESIMRTVARWYDVDVEISNQIRGRRFGGTISRFGQLSTLLGMMEKTGVIHFKIEGRRVIVMP